MSHRSAARLMEAEQKAIAARARFRATLEQAQTRLSPENIVNEVMGEVRSRSLSVTSQAVESLRSRPVMSTLLVSLAGILINHRATIFALLKLLLQRKRATSGASGHSSRKSARSRDMEVEA